MHSTHITATMLKMPVLNAAFSLSVKMENSDLLEVQHHLRVVWRCAGMRSGALSVMTFGQGLMHKWPATSWDTQQLVHNPFGVLLEALA